MLDLIKAIKDTPVPTILTVAGIIFLLLGVAGGIVGKINVAQERQRISLAVGAVLLALGIAIYLIPVGPRDGDDLIVVGPRDVHDHPGDKTIQIECQPEPVPHDQHGRAIRLIVRTHTQQKAPIAGADVRIDPGGPWMNPSGAREVFGRTDHNGIFGTIWVSPDPRAAGEIHVTATAEGFAEGSTNCGIPPPPP